MMKSLRNFLLSRSAVSAMLALTGLATFWIVLSTRREDTLLMVLGLLFTFYGFLVMKIREDDVPSLDDV